MCIRDRKSHLASFGGRILLLAETAGRRETLAAMFAEHGIKLEASTDFAGFVGSDAKMALGIALACREQYVRNVAVTADYIHPEPAKEFFAVMDAANVDLKAFTDAFYHKLCVAHLQPVLDILAYIHHETDCWLEITTLLIPGKNLSLIHISEPTRPY